MARLLISYNVTGSQKFNMVAIKTEAILYVGSQMRSKRDLKNLDPGFLGSGIRHATADIDICNRKLEIQDGPLRLLPKVFRRSLVAILQEIHASHLACIIVAISIFLLRVTTGNIRYGAVAFLNSENLGKFRCYSIMNAINSGNF